MQLDMADAKNCFYSAEDGGSVTNNSDRIILNRVPTSQEMIALFEEFDEKFRRSLFQLLSMPWGEIERKYGSVGKLRRSNATDRADQLYAFVREPTRNYLLTINSKALAPLLGGATVKGTVRRKFTSMGKSPDEVVGEMSRYHQIQLIENLVEGDLDALLRVSPNSLLGWNELSTNVKTMSDVGTFLSGLALEVENFVTSQRVGGDGTRGSGRRYAASWFGQFLALKGVWLFPLNYCASVKYFYPNRLRPILAWMTVPEKAQPLADLMTTIDADRSKSSLGYCLNALITAGLSSDMWREHRLCTAPLELMKRVNARETARFNQNFSSSLNRVYRALVDAFEAKMIERPEASLFLRHKRLNAASTSGLRWCSDPNVRNTRRARQILGREITSVPCYVRRIGQELEETLKHFKVIHVSQITDALSVFLIYVMSLNENDAPKSLVNIDRERHINNLTEHGATFRNFLIDHYSESGRDVGGRAMGALEKAWRISSHLHGFGKTFANPVDASNDNPIEYRKRRARSTREAIIDEVYQVILWENIRDDYAFARTLDFLYRTVCPPGSDTEVRIFWPCAPLVLESCARSATRGKSARYADSGEGDELRYDFKSRRMVKNLGKHAVAGRQQGFIQSMSIYTEGERREVPTLHVASAKTGAYDVPYVDPEFASRFLDFVELQERYNPVDGPTLALDTRHQSEDGDVSNVPEVYMAFREPGLGYSTAISQERVTGYLAALLTHCEPIVKEVLGYEYPLVRDGKPLIGLHAFRVTANTRLQARGGTREDAAKLLGHKSVVYADYYNNPPLVDSYTRIANAAALDREVTRPNSNDSLLQYADEQEALFGGPTRASVQLREGAGGGTRVDFMNHGICTGECSTGGPVLNGRPTPVWRNRACSQCLHRASGPTYLKQLSVRVNCLAWEIRQSYRRSAQFNEDLETARSRGQPIKAIESALKAEQTLRSNLDQEHQAEIFNIKKFELAAQEVGDNAIFGPSSGRLDRDIVEFREVHEFELLQSLVKDLDLQPSLRIDFDPSIELEWERIISAVARANRLDEILYDAIGTKRQKLIATGDAILDRVHEVSEMQLLIDKAFASDSYPPLVKWKAAIRRQLSNAVPMIGQH